MVTTMLPSPPKKGWGMMVISTYRMVLSKRNNIRRNFANSRSVADIAWHTVGGRTRDSRVVSEAT